VPVGVRLGVLGDLVPPCLPWVLALTLWCRPYRLEVSAACPRFSLLGGPCPQQVTCCLWVFRENLGNEL
jgi:hypothetical protein